MNKIIIILLTTLILSCSKEAEVEVLTKTDNIFFAEGITKAETKMMAPDFTLEDLNGQKVSLSDYRGKAILLNFWAHWCGPCKEEMPSINNLHKIVKNLDIIVLTVNLGESHKIVSDYMNENGYEFKALLDSKQKVGAMFGIRSIPTTYIIDKGGMIVASKLGSHEWDSDNVVKILEGI